MLCYLLHQSPPWESLQNGKRNVRIIFLALAMYIILHALAFEFKSRSIICKILYEYFWWIFVADIFVCGCYYKWYYGRSMILELDPHEHDVWNETEHRYYPKDKIKEEKPIQTDEIKLTEAVEQIEQIEQIEPIEEIKPTQL